MSEREYPKGIRLDPPAKGRPEFVKKRCGIHLPTLIEWAKDKVDDRQWVNFDLLDGKNGLYFQYSAPPARVPDGAGARIQSVDREKYSVSSKTDQPLDDEIPF
jgi:hypothetical protein